MNLQVFWKLINLNYRYPYLDVQGNLLIQLSKNVHDQTNVFFLVCKACVSSIFCAFNIDSSTNFFWKELLLFFGCENLFSEISMDLNAG